MLITDVFVWLNLNCKSLNFRSVDTHSAQLHCHMDYFIYCRHANSTHLPYSSFACNFDFEFSSLALRIDHGPLSPPGLLPLIGRGIEDAKIDIFRKIIIEFILESTPKTVSQTLVFDKKLKVNTCSKTKQKKQQHNLNQTN